MSGKHKPSQFDRKQRQQQEEHLKFLQECYTKLVRFQLDNEIVLVPFMAGPWMNPGQQRIEVDLTFRKMTDQERVQLREQDRKNSVIEPAGQSKEIVTE